MDHLQIVAYIVQPFLVICGPFFDSKFQWKATEQQFEKKKLWLKLIFNKTNELKLQQLIK